MQHEHIISQAFVAFAAVLSVVSAWLVDCGDVTHAMATGVTAGAVALASVVIHVCE